MLLYPCYTLQDAPPAVVEDPWPVIATLSRIDQPLTLPSKAARTIVTVGSVPVTLLVPSTSADETGASVQCVQAALTIAPWDQNLVASGGPILDPRCRGVLVLSLDCICSGFMYAAIRVRRVRATSAAEFGARRIGVLSRVPPP